MRTRKIIAVILSILFVLSVFPVAASAQSAPVDKAVLIDIKDRIFNAIYDENTQVVDGIIELDLRDLGIPANRTIISYISRYINTSGSLFACRNSFSVYSNNDIVTRIAVKAKTTPAQNKAMLEQCEVAMASILYGVKGNTSLSDADKCLIVHDRLCVWCEYDYANYLKGNIPDVSYTAYGALVNRICVCDGYTLAYGWLLEQLGIETEYVDSETLGHSWVKVFIDSEPYFIDLAFDDPVWDIPGRVLHSNCLISYSRFASLHNSASDYDTDVPSTKYDNYYPQGSDTQVLTIGDAVYYLRDSAVNPDKCALVKRDAAGEAEVLLLDKTYSYQSGAYIYSFSANHRILNIGNEIIYTMPREVRSYNTATGVDKLIYTPTSAILRGVDYILSGMKQIDGEIYVTSQQGPNIYTDNSNPDGYAAMMARNTEHFTYCTHTDRESEIYESVDCTQSVEVIMVCKACRKAEKETIQGMDHQFEWTVTREAKCGVAGEETQICSVCGAHGLTQDIPALEHSYGWVTVTEADCGAPGLKQYKCSLCGDISDTQEIPALEHDYSITYTWSKDKSTCTALAVCSHNSSHTVSEQVNSRVDTQNPSCTKPGESVYTATFTNALFEEKTETVPLPATGHHYNEQIIREATCTEDGEKKLTCPDCGDEKTETIQHTGHSASWRTSVPATTEREGTEEYYCPKCKQVLDTRTIPKTPVIIINNTSHSGSSVDYKSTVKFTVSTVNMPGDAVIRWFKNGSPTDKYGESYTETKATSGFRVQAKIIRGSIVLAESQEESVGVNGGFIQILIAFFRQLFGSLPVVDW